MFDVGLGREGARKRAHWRHVGGQLGGKLLFAAGVDGFQRRRCVKACAGVRG